MLRDDMARMLRRPFSWNGVALLIIIAGFVAMGMYANQRSAQAQAPDERPPCDEMGACMLWGDGSDLEVCDGTIWVEFPNAGDVMREPWAVLVLYAGGNQQILLFQDGNEANNQSRALMSMGLRIIECVAIYHRGDLMTVDPPACEPRGR